MRAIDADRLSYKVKCECNPYGKPTIDYESGNKVLDWIENAPTVEINTNDIEYKAYCKGLEDGKKIARPPHGEWIPVSERRFPDDETEVLIQYGQSMMVGYHIFDHTIYPFEYEDENETGWYDSKDDFICGSDEVIAWMPLPEPYKEETDND